MNNIKPYLIIIISALLIIACENKQDSKNKIVPEVDERVELMSILARLADYEEYKDSTYSDYVNRINEYFREFKNSKAVLTLKELRDSTNLAYDGIMSMAVNLDLRNNKIVPLENISNKDDRWPLKESDRFYLELTEFYNVTEFHNWFNSNKAIYDDIISNARQMGEIHKYWFKDFFGYTNPQKFRLILGLGNGYGNYGPSSNNNDEITNYAIIGTGDIDESGKLVFYEDEFIPIIIHEFLHSYINPFTSFNISQLETSGDQIYNTTIDEMNKLAYGDGETVINESLVRACVIQYMTDYGYKDDEIVFEIISNKKIGFYWIEELVNILKHYTLNRADYPSFMDYKEKISEIFTDIAQNTSKLKEDYESQKATIVSSSPDINEIVSHETNEISFTLDQVFLEDYYGFGPVYKQNELYPKYGDDDSNFIYSNGNKTLTIKNVSLEPKSNYRIKLIGNMTYTREGNTCHNYELTFKTK